MSSDVVIIGLVIGIVMLFVLSSVFRIINVIKVIGVYSVLCIECEVSVFYMFMVIIVSKWLVFVSGCRNLVSRLFLVVWFGCFGWVNVMDVLNVSVMVVVGWMK